MKKLTFLLFVLLYVTAYSQPALHWNNYFGGPENESARDVIQNSAGNFVMAGNTHSFGAGESDMYLLVVDPDGLPGASWTYGGEGNESAYSVKQTSDGGYIIAGSTDTYAAPSHLRDMWLVKVNAAGGEEWSKTYVEGSAACVSLTDDGEGVTGYIIAGANLIKTDELGNVQWSQPFSCVSAMQTSDGGYIALGGSFSVSMELIRLDNSGTIIWTRYFGGPGLDFAEEVIETADGGFMIASTTASYGAGELDAWIIKTNDQGIEEWSETYGDVFHDECHGICQTEDGGYILTGIKQVNTIYNNDVWVIKIDAQGTMQWDWSLDLGDNNWGQAVIQTADNGYAVTGMTRAEGAAADDMYLISFWPDELTAWFTGTPTVIAPGACVQFTDGTLGDPLNYTYKWTFDMGAGNDDIVVTDNLSPSINYPDGGTFDVTFEWIENDNPVSSLTRSEYITVSNMTPPTDYCTSFGDASANWIKSVDVDGTINTSTAVGYEDYTHIIFNLSAGQTYNIVLEPGANPGKKVPKWWQVWIDFNIDGDFFDAGENVFTSEAEKGSVSGTIAIPSNFSGDTRMRVSMSADGATGPCDDSFNGEVEDYTISVAPPTPQAPVADFSADNTYVPVGSTVYFTDLSINSPDAWLWSFDGGDPASSTDQNPSVIYPIADTYTVSLTASNTLGSDTETKEGYIIVTSGTAPAPYCEPENIQNNLITYIDEIFIGTYSNSSGYDPGGYVHFTNLDPFELVIGEDYSVLLIPSDNRGRFFWRIWVDLDGNGNFEGTGELMFIANNKKGNVSGNISIPADASASGITRMRISMKRNAAQSGPCEDDFDGEVEDYNVFFSSSDAILSISSMNDLSDITLYPNPVHGDQLTIEFDNHSQQTSIQVYNKFGAVIDHIETSSNKITLNVAHYAIGMYFVKVNIAGELYVMKFVKR